MDDEQRRLPDATELLEASPDAIIFADRSGLIRYWNQAATGVFGFPPDEVLGQSLDLIVPERFREAHWTGFERAMGEGRTKYAGQALPTRAVRKDGTQIYVELAFAVVLAGDEAIGALATARDITERFEREREQRQRLRELEGQAAAGGPASA